METDQARRLVTLHDNADRALANLRNANAMATDDPRAPELLEEAGDAYAESFTGLAEAQDAIIDAAAPPEGGLLDEVAEVGKDLTANPEGFEPGKAAWIVGGDVGDGGAGFIADGVEGVAEGNVALRLTTPAKYKGSDYPEGATISVPVEALALEQPEGAPSVDVAATDGARKDQGAKTA